MKHHADDVNPGQHRRRSGIAAAEFAVCLPVLLVIVFGSIEACTMIFFKQSLTVAAYEGVRVAVKHNATNTDVGAAGNQILSDRKVKDGTIVTIPADISTAPVGSYITVRVTAPCNSNSALRGWFFNNYSLHGDATMMKEF
jgi:Flp pilus assembly protein TadG